jgi:predicted lipoprotein
VDALHQDSGIKYTGTFESVKRDTRVTLYRAKVSPDGGKRLLLEVQKDKIKDNSIFIAVQNPTVQVDFKEFEITVK